MPTEEEILFERIRNYEQTMASAQTEIKFLNTQITEQETKYIEAKLFRDQAKEKIRLFLLQKPSYETTSRDEEIARFKQILPEVMEKI